MHILEIEECCQRNICRPAQAELPFQNQNLPQVPLSVNLFKCASLAWYLHGWGIGSMGSRQ